MPTADASFNGNGNGSAPGQTGRTFAYDASGSISEHLRQEVYARLTAEQLYTHASHRWHKSPGKWRGGCPWHESESGTSFVVTPDKLLWYCAGCQVGGGPVEYLWKLRNGAGVTPRGPDFQVIYRELCALAGVPPLEREQSAEESRWECRRAILVVAAEYCQQVLWSPAGDRARAYLLSRGFTDEDVRSLSLGLYLSRQGVGDFLRRGGYPDADVRDAKILTSAMEGYIIFLWPDEYGRPLTLYGTWQEREPPPGKPKKMALAGESTKRSPLYFDRARRAGHKDLTLVEGLTDAALLQCRGATEVISPVANKLSREQAHTLARHGVRSVSLVLDPDEGGKNGTPSCIKMLQDVGIVAYVAPWLPSGMDPDEYVQANGIVAWRAHVEKAIHAYRYQALTIVQKDAAAIGSDRGRDAVLAEALDFAAGLPADKADELERHFWPEIIQATGASMEGIMARQGRSGAKEQPNERHGAADRHQGEGAPSAPWPDPQPIAEDLPPVLPFDYGMLPGAFRGYVEDVAERLQCPPDFIAVAVMVAEAGVVGKKIGIRPKRHDDWLVVANLWGAVIGRPGIMKSPAIELPMRLLRWLQVEAQKRYAQDLRDYEEALLVANAKKEQKKQDIKNALKIKNPEESAKKLEEAKNLVIEDPKQPIPRRYVVNDSTVEKLGELLNQNPNGLTVFRDEITGLLQQLEKEGQEGARAFYLEAWGGLGKFTYDRIARGTLHIESVTLSILGGIQPSRLLAYLQPALHGGGDDDGLIQRFQLLVYPDINKRWRNVDRWPDTMAKQQVWNVLARLDQLDPATVGAETDDHDDGVPFLRFAPQAQGAFDDWRAELEHKIRSGEEHPAIESHLAKYRSLIPSLALLIHLADAESGPVGEIAVGKAIAWARYLESHARRVYSMVTNPAGVAAKALASRIEKGELEDGFSLRELYRKHWAGLSDKEAVEPAVDALVSLHWLAEVVEKTDGRPKVFYRINPKLQAKTAGEGSAKSAKSPQDHPNGTFGTGHRGPFVLRATGGGPQEQGTDGGREATPDGHGEAWEGD